MQCPALPQNVVGLNRLAYVVAIVLLAGCGSSSAAARQSPAASPTSSASPTASPTSGTSPSAAPKPSPTPLPVGQYAVLVTQGTGDTYAVSIVGTDGRVVASAQPSNPTQMTCGDALAAVLPVPVSTTSTRVYFLDAQGNVNFLTPNGETGHATRVPSSGNVRSMFTVSPDDRQIAVIQNTYNSSGATTVLYVEDLNGGTHHVKLYTQTGGYTLWPTGWHGGNIVLAKVPACTQGGGPFCCGPMELHVVDAATAARRYTLGGSQCIIAGPPTTAGVVCENTSNYSQGTVLNWTGATVRHFTIQGPVSAELSPDGTAVALSSNTGTTFEGIKRSLDLEACGWIDNQHVIAGGDTEQQPRIGDVTTGVIVAINAQGVCGGVIPGGL